MIIFYDSKTKKIYGTIEGRAHPKEFLTDKIEIKPDHVPEERRKKFIVPFERSGDELLPKQPFREMVLNFERGKVSPLNCKVDIDKRGNVTGFSMIKFKKGNYALDKN